MVRVSSQHMWPCLPYIYLTFSFPWISYPYLYQSWKKKKPKQTIKPHNKKAPNKQTKPKPTTLVCNLFCQTRKGLDWLCCDFQFCKNRIKYLYIFPLRADSQPPVISFAGICSACNGMGFTAFWGITKKLLVCLKRPDTDTLIEHWVGKTHCASILCKVACNEKLFFVFKNTGKPKFKHR